MTPSAIRQPRQCHLVHTIHHRRCLPWSTRDVSSAQVRADAQARVLPRLPTRSHRTPAAQRPPPAGRPPPGSTATGGATSPRPPAAPPGPNSDVIGRCPRTSLTTETEDRIQPGAFAGDQLGCLRPADPRQRTQGGAGDRPASTVIRASDCLSNPTHAKAGLLAPLGPGAVHRTLPICLPLH